MSRYGTGTSANHPGADVTATLETLVRRFYHDLWNRFDSTLIPVLLTEDVTLRGALGRHAAGHAAFADYLELVRGAFPDFEQTVEAVEVDAVGGSAFVRLRCRGTHRGALFGLPARPAGASRSKEPPASRPATAGSPTSGSSATCTVWCDNSGPNGNNPRR